MNLEHWKFMIQMIEEHQRRLKRFMRDFERLHLYTAIARFLAEELVSSRDFIKVAVTLDNS